MSFDLQGDNTTAFTSIGVQVSTGAGVLMDMDFLVELHFQATLYFRLMKPLIFSNHLHPYLEGSIFSTHPFLLEQHPQLPHPILLFIKSLNFNFEKISFDN